MNADANAFHYPPSCYQPNHPLTVSPTVASPSSLRFLLASSRAFVNSLTRFATPTSDSASARMACSSSSLTICGWSFVRFLSAFRASSVSLNSLSATFSACDCCFSSVVVPSGTGDGEEKGGGVVGERDWDNIGGNEGIGCPASLAASIAFSWSSMRW